MPKRLVIGKFKPLSKLDEIRSKLNTPLSVDKFCCNSTKIGVELFGCKTIVDSSIRFVVKKITTRYYNGSTSINIIIIQKDLID